QSALRACRPALCAPKVAGLHPVHQNALPDDVVVPAHARLQTKPLQVVLPHLLASIRPIPSPVLLLPRVRGPVAVAQTILVEERPVPATVPSPLHHEIPAGSRSATSLPGAAPEAASRALSPGSPEPPLRPFAGHL